MKARSSLPCAVAFALVLVSAAAHADEPELTPPETLPTHVLVHIKSPEPVQLESRAAGQKGWVTACVAPCDTELPLADEYRIAYRTKEPSSEKPFRLAPGADGAVMLKVHPSSVGGKVGGGVLIGLGAVAATIGALGLIGGIGLAAGPADSCRDSSNDWCVDDHALGSALILISLVPLLLGGGMIAGGVAITADANAHTEQRPWAGREPVWVGPRAEGAPKRAGFVTPLSFAF